MITTLFLDVYGTLISTGTGSVDAAAKILQIAGSDLEPAAFYRRWKVLHKAHSQGPFRREEDIFVADLAKLYEAYGICRSARQDITPMLDSLYGRSAFPDVTALWPELKKRYRLIIASNTDTQPLMANLRANGLEADAVYTSESLEAYKPSPAFYEKLLADTGVNPREAAFVGDSLEEDVLAPQRAGMKGILLDRKGSYAKPSGGASPFRVISSFRDLEKIE